MSKPKSNRAKCQYWLDRADNPNPSRFSDPRMAADGQAALFVDAPTADLFSFAPVANPLPPVDGAAVELDAAARRATAAWRRYLNSRP